MDETSGFGYWGGMSEEILKRDYPLHRACRDGDVEALSLLLLQAQHSVYVEDTFYGWTPAHWAAYFGRTSRPVEEFEARKLNCLMRLLEHGMNCDVTTFRFNQSPAHIAAFASRGHCLKWLLHCGAAYNRQDYLGETPIHKAARTGSMECISLLASHGASLTIRSYSGNIPAQLARNCGYEECANYLERALEQQKLQQTGQTPGLLPPVTANEESSEKNHDCVVKQGLNGGLLPPPDTVTTNGINGINEQDHEMEEMDSDSHDLHQGQGDGPQGHHLSNPPVVNGHINAHPHLHPTVNGSSQVHLNGDILLQNGVSSNLVPIAGHKRCREDDGEENYKKVRRGDEYRNESDREHTTCNLQNYVPNFPQSDALCSTSESPLGQLPQVTEAMESEANFDEPSGGTTTFTYSDILSISTEPLKQPEIIWEAEDEVSEDPHYWLVMV